MSICLVKDAFFRYLRRIVYVTYDRSSACVLVISSFHNFKMSGNVRLTYAHMSGKLISEETFLLHLSGFERFDIVALARLLGTILATETGRY